MRLTCLSGLVALCLIAVTLQRAPLVWIDEVYFASAARSLAAGGDGTPTVEPASTSSFPFPLLHGPVFFWLDAVALQYAGVSPLGGRLVSFVGAILTALAGAALAGLLAGSRRWGMAAFGLIMLTPEIGSSAANARMDTLAVGLEISGMAAFVWGMATARNAVAGGALAGVFWGAALLTTTRTFPFGVAMAAAAAVALVRGKPFDRKTLTIASATTAVVVFAAVVSWTGHLHVSPVEWVRRTLAGARGTDSVSLGFDKAWSVTVPNVLTTVLLLPAMAAVLMAPRRERTRAGAGMFVLAVALVTTAFPMIFANNVFLRSIQFAILLAVATIGIVGVLPDGARRRALLQWGVCGLLLMAGVRSVKTLDVLATWAVRSPAAFDGLIAHVPPGSLVVGYDEFYFYAVEQSGSIFQSFRTDPWHYASGPLRAAWADRIDRRPRQPRHPDFLIWPDDPHWPMPDHLQCAQPFPLARYDAALERSIVDRLPGLTQLGYLRRYPNTVLYRVPPGCEL